MMNVLFYSNGFNCRVAAVNLLPAYRPVRAHLEVVQFPLLQLCVCEGYCAPLGDSLYGLIATGFLCGTVDHISACAGDPAPLDRRFPLACRQGFDGRLRQRSHGVSVIGKTAVQSVLALTVCVESRCVRPDAVVILRAGQTGRIFIGKGAVPLDRFQQFETACTAFGTIDLISRHISHF